MKSSQPSLEAELGAGISYVRPKESLFEQEKQNLVKKLLRKGLITPQFESGGGFSGYRDVRSGALFSSEKEMLEWYE